MNSDAACLNQQQTIDLMNQYKESSCNDAATALLTHYESIVKIAAAKMSRNRPDLYEDLYQVGQLSMLRLFKQFDRSKEIPFEGYAMKSIIGHLKNYLRDKSWYIQVPRRIKEKGLLIQKAIDQLTTELERSPKIDEIARRLELSEEETIEILSSRESYHYVSLDTPLSSEADSATIGDVIGDQQDDYGLVEKRLDLEEALAHLKDEERTVLVLAYQHGQSQRDIADQLGVSQMSVSRFQKRALEKLKRLLQDRTESTDG
ncbi:sigma-70 family RNA polymerase sigma factor [Paenibacillus radicis (ex Gao et al. 2016)]|uniref:RNA polymerase sigma factor n=1 Tax=Paenibacillus radicis (ex Gao et al. 2016) TaxID=1737354 RepID=A0A917LTS2_9BACL|nr:sigma-70 family RNA polymerase sigma factor [Paenibacillus radicis (ex Gao et al. 2016)]GGG56915.1 RNA polymerase sigma factor [Paenibacillus radicis (ex Gao et al. 2016)]